MNGFPRSPRSLVLVYVLATALSFPVFEILLRGDRARDFAHDVFDDGAVSRLGALRFDWAAYGPVLWNSHLMAGNSYFGQFNATPVSIDALLAMATSPFAAYVSCVVLMALLAGLSLHVFLERSVGLPRLAALAGGLVYVFGFRNYGFGFSAILLPLLLWLSDRAEIRRDSGFRRLVPLSLCAAFLLYDFSPQPAALTGALHLAYCFVAAQSPEERRSRLRAWAASWALGFALYAPELFNLVTLLPESERAIRNNLAGVPSLSAAVSMWLQYYVELFAGRPVAMELGLRLHEAADGTWYPGFVGLILVAAAAGLRRENRRERAIGALLLALPAIDLLSLVLTPYQKNFGVLRSFELNRIRIFLPFAVAANVAVALGVLLRVGQGLVGSMSRRRVLYAVGGVGLFASALLCGRSVAYLVRRGGVWAEDPSLRSRVIAWGGATLYFAVGAALTIWLIRILRGRERFAAWGGAALVVVGLLSLERLAYSRIERAVEDRNLGSWNEALGDTPAIHFLSAQPNPGSLRVLMLADRSKPNHRDHPNRLMFSGLFCVDGYQNVYPLRYHELFGRMTAPHLMKDPERYAYFHNWGQRAYAFGPELNTNLASLMGVRWLYARGVPVTDGPWRLVFSDRDERVYENPSAFPRAFLASRASGFPTRTAVLGAMEAASLETLRTTAYFEGTMPAELGDLAPDASAGVTLSVDTPDRLVFDVRSGGSATLVVTDSYEPGWTATVNGARREIVPVDGCFQGVAVPKGRSSVLFRYEPASVRAGAAVAIGGAAVLGFLCLPRRSSPAAPDGGVPR